MTMTELPAGRNGSPTAFLTGTSPPRRRRQAKEYDLGPKHRGLQVPREFDPFLFQVALEDVLEPRLVYRDLAGGELLHHVRIVVHAEDLVAPLGEAYPRHQPDVSGPDDCDVHRSAPFHAISKTFLRYLIIGISGIFL